MNVRRGDYVTMTLPTFFGFVCLQRQRRAGLKFQLNSKAKVETNWWLLYHLIYKD